MRTLSHLSDSQLAAQMPVLCQKEREAISDIVLHLSEIESRGSYRALGYSSLFTYCTAGCGYSEGAAMRRIKAARCVRENPEVYEKLQSGKLTLCALSELSRVLNAENKEVLIKASEGQSKRKVEALVSTLLPPELPKKERIKATQVLISPPPLLVAPSLAEPVVEQRYTITMQVDPEFMELLTKARALSGAMVTSEVLKKTLKTYVTQKDPVVRAERRAKRQVRVKTSKVLVTRHIPTATRDRVFVRDGARCSYVSAEGKRCSETHNLQIDHCRPWAKGGGHEEDNLRVLCPTHNRFVAEQVFGKDKVPSRVRR